MLIQLPLPIQLILFLL